MLTNEQIDAIRARCEKATPGPWIYNQQTERLVSGEGTEDERVVIEYAGEIIGKNLALIANARQDIPSLLEDLGEIKAISELRLNEYRSLLRKMESETARTEAYKQNCSHLMTDRDRWKSYAEALERAAKERLTGFGLCTICVYVEKIDVAGFPHCNVAEKCGENALWQFDEARFMPEGSDNP
jgi:hypothetical protein